MKRTVERPIRTPERGHSGRGYVESHPAYAMIGASRVSIGPTGRRLAGSDFAHRHAVTVTIRGAEVRRDLATDWWHGRNDIIEVTLSEAQWATFIATPNVGFGTPCTLEFVRDVGFVPGIAAIEDRRAQLTSEVDNDLRDAIEAIEALRDAAPTKRLRDQADLALRRLTDGLPFIAKRFDEHAEDTVERAKIEVEAYLTNAVQRAGLAALGAPEPPLALGDGEEEPTE